MKLLELVEESLQSYCLCIRIEPGLTISQLEWQLWRKVECGQKQGQTVLCKEWLEPMNTTGNQKKPNWNSSVSRLLYLVSDGWPSGEVGVICHRATCTLGSRQREAEGRDRAGGGGVVSQQSDEPADQQPHVTVATVPEPCTNLQNLKTWLLHHYCLRNLAQVSFMPTLTQNNTGKQILGNMFPEG